ncbi:MULTISPECIES: TrlF family AAA-like ATPase [unclassified Rathayibacter]|uniref:TrlF family AAA-like ATPase n=1 Tax=unclassified Rathayibacter TaxID=2609250 RepID=UPI0009E82BF7|nr:MULTISPECIES: AAA family ATPase [unclassified Rathayibacter]
MPEMTSIASGAHWIRAALQVNPYSYEGRNAPSSYFEDEAAYNEALLTECQKLGISLIAVTDHWRVDSAAGLIAAASEKGIVALPGFEANSSEGVHILVIFDVGTDFSAINASIGRCGVRPNCANGTTGASYSGILQRMTEDDALVIPAHANVHPAGLLTTRAGQPLATMIQTPELHAIGITPTVTETRDQAAVVAGTGIFKRPHPLAVIHADDVMGPRQLRTDGASSWFKVSAPTLRSLKLAVRTPATRISVSNPATQPRTTMKNISWVGGYLDGVNVPISEDLTALIGGRGAGKSTIIESIRYALDLDPITPQVKADHRKIVSAVLRGGTIIRIEIEAVNPVPQRFTIEREIPHPPVVMDAAGNRTNLTPTEVLGPVEIFGQHELAELAGSTERVAELVRRFDGELEDEADLQRTLRQLRTNREDLIRAEEALDEIDGELARIPGLTEQVAHWEATDVPTKLAGQQRLGRDEAIFEEGAGRARAVGDVWNSFAQAHALRDLAAPLADVDGAPQEEYLTRVVDALERLRSRTTEVLSSMGEALTSARNDIEAARAEWQAATADEASSYGEVVRELHDRKLDPDRFVSIQQELDRLQAAEPRRTTQRQDLQTLLERRAALLAELRGHETRRTERLHAAISAANSATGGVVVARPIAASERSHILDAIRPYITTQRTQISAAIAADSFSPRRLATAIREGVGALDEMGIRGAQAAALIASGERLARELDELRIDLAVEVLLQVNGTGLRSMEQLSKGQRATALLLLLLAASNAPLIIDQPEDDLDNNFVYRGVVTKLRELKGRRQIIASTHNANVPVLGDAELIVALESDGVHGSPSPSGIGSLDDAEIRALAENILEGGPAAFNARQHLYGF